MPETFLFLIFNIATLFPFWYYLFSYKIGGQYNLIYL